MRKTILILAALFWVCILRVDLTGASERSLTYHDYENKEGVETVTGETFIHIKDLPGDQMFLSRQKQEEGSKLNDEFILDRDYSLESWKRICLEEDTDLTSVRGGDLLVVKGKLKGKMIDQEIELGGKALHIYPKYSLGKFALSAMTEMKFWTLRRDEMSKIPMQAKKKGTKIITVNGKEVEAVEVYYSITGKLREKHYNHTSFYRKSDGLFIKKVISESKGEDLVKEE